MHRMPETSSGSWGFSIRDSHDHTVCFQGLQEAINHGIGHMILETDAMLVIQAIKENEVSKYVPPHVNIFY
jgi:hypothetical protein